MKLTVPKIKYKRFLAVLDQLNFSHIFLIWIAVVVLFGFAYFVLGNGAALVHAQTQTPVTGFLDHLYFSFVSATTTGFGDIVPTGVFKLVAILEVVAAFLLLALVTSKLVSLKQDIILNEIYDISFNERVNRLRSSLLLFRQNIERLIQKVEDKTVSVREVNGAALYITQFEETLREVVTLFATKKGDYTKNIGPVSRELLVNSILLSFEKLEETLKLLDSHEHHWKSATNLRHVNACITFNKALFQELGTVLESDKLVDIAQRNDAVIGRLKTCVVR
jgi:hypothetical protein